MISSEACEDESTQNESINNVLDMFREYSKVKKMMLEIPSVVETSAVAGSTPQPSGDSAQFTSEKAFEDLKTILDQYQEQPHLLDPHLEELVGNLVSLVKEVGRTSLANPNDEFYKDTKAPKAMIAQQAFKYIYLLIKVRGYKIIVNKLPHEVKDLLPVLDMLEHSSDKQGDSFYCSYVLLLWLSIIVYMPFNIADFDATTGQQSAEEGGQPTGVVPRLLAAIRLYLRSPQASREMAAFLASKLVTRPDLRDVELPAFVDHCLQVVENDTSEEVFNSFHRLGCLRALGLVWKHGRRQELLPLSGPTLKRLLQVQLTESPDSSLRKLSIKLVQRIALTFLPPRLAAWRYRRGNRSLLINMGAEKGQGGEAKQEVMEEEDEEDFDVAPELEDVIDELLKGLKDTDTVVRWSSSKGVGRVCGRLSRDMAGEVVSAVLSSFTPRDTHNMWHGGCLALAELGRRGLLLPDTLPEVVTVLEKAFVYDKLMGQCSVGANIRDAACYLCWSLARAYDPETLKPFVQRLATGLLIVALFDREIPCRHAAAAAFQEHVGRQGCFSHGIEILTTVDYFAVGIRANAYLKLSPFVASFVEYSVALVDHLVEHKLSHWDTVIRELAAKTLHLLVKHCPQHCSRVVLPRLLDTATGVVLVERHGAILALGNVINALSDMACNVFFLNYHHFVSEEVVSRVSALCGQLADRRLLQGVGGAYMRLALSDLIRQTANAQIVVSQDTANTWLELLEESAMFVEEDVRAAAVKGLESLWLTYFSKDTSEDKSDKVGAEVLSDNTIKTVTSDDTQTGSEGSLKCSKQSIILPSSAISKYLSALSSERESHAQGMALALGMLPLPVLRLHCDKVLMGLLSAALVTPDTASWAATRRDAIASATAAITTLGLRNPDGVTQQMLDHSFDTLLRCLEDYTTDRRGDVGAWVREAAVTAIQKLLVLAVEDQKTDTDSSAARPSPAHVAGAITRIAQLSVERIDRTRRVAGAALASIIHHSPRIPHIPHHDQLLETLLPADFCSSVNWGSDRDTFSAFSLMLNLPQYRARLIMGFAYSLGGVSANLAQSASDALDAHVTSLGEEAESKSDQFEPPSSDAGVGSFVLVLLSLLEDQALRERLSLPLLKTIEHFMTSTSLLDEALEQDPTLCDKLLSSLKRECRGCHDYHKLVVVSTTLCEMLRLHSTCTKSALNQLLLFLGYQYPKVRTVTASSLLTALQDYSDDLMERGVLPSQEVLDTVVEMLEDTPWMEVSLAEGRERRNKCCEALGLPVPAVRKKP